MEDAKSAAAIQADAADRELWAQGYIPDNDDIVDPEFSIGSFFDDDLYS